MNNQDNLNELTKTLSEAIQSGDSLKAQHIAVELAKHRLKLDMDIIQDQNEQNAKNVPFSVNVQVEDRESSGPCFELTVRSCDRIGDLKQRVFQAYKFPVLTQKWIVGKKIPDDNTRLSKLEVQASTPLFLYLLSAKTVGLQRTDGENRHSTVNRLQEPAAQSSIVTDNCVSNVSSSISSDVSRTFSEPAANVAVGDRVSYQIGNRDENGTVRWIGPLPDIEGSVDYAGVELDNAVGNGEGTYNGKVYFTAKPKHGLFIVVHRLKQLTSMDESDN